MEPSRPGGQTTLAKLGLGSTTPSNAQSPIQVPGLSNVTAVSDGLATFDLALLSNGTVEAWGSNSGNLGDGITGASPPLTDDNPQPVVGLAGVTAISAAPGDSLALLDNGTVMVWGDFDFEATPGHNKPVLMEGLSGVKAVSARGSSNNLALLDNGTVAAWGSPGCICDSQPGTGANTPVPIKGLPNVVAISTGVYLDLALLKNGTVMEWSVSIGDQEEPAAMGQPRVVKGLSGVTAISAGDNSGTAISKGGSAFIWGDSSYAHGDPNVGISPKHGSEPKFGSRASGCEMDRRR